MAPIFASPDIASLVESFSPSSPTILEPTIVRTRSDDHVKDSRSVANDFRHLLENSPSRIRLSDLPSRLGVAEIDWLLNPNTVDLFWDRDSQALLPRPVTHEIQQSIAALLEQQVCRSTRLQTEFDVRSDSLPRLLESGTNELGQVQPFEDGESAEPYYYSSKLATQTEENILSCLRGVRDEKVDLKSRYPDVPSALLHQWAEKAVDALEQGKGDLEFSTGRLLFVPSAYTTILQERQHKEKSQKVQSYVERLLSDGVARIEISEATENTRQEVEAEAAQRAGQAISTQPSTRTDDTILFLSSRLESSLGQLKSRTPSVATDVWHERDGSASLESVVSLVLQALQELSTDVLEKELLETPCQEEIANAAGEFLGESQKRETEEFAQHVKQRLIAPIVLYVKGGASVTDQTLKQHLEEFLGDHFRREAIPSVTQQAKEAHLLVEKGRKREFEKMQQACAESKTLSDIQTAVNKFARKQKIEAPDADTLRVIKQQTLRQRVKSMRSMKRGSDLLQNLIWVLLSHSSDGLFMSSGKDTTRMIKQYQAVGDEALGKRLEAWRDSLKAGNERKTDLQDMRELAAQVIDGSNADDPARQSEGANGTG
ncbi:hypothetical protein KC332_g10213 [Hortaea werneckii]|uniref:Uncharacterized protein n=1 Tax=Hortaea werneckii TaxID=91943 RepID=A0A3M7GTI1_HORWE|nr:hypothetical protein KC350_g9463 [Hortaea werneckii]KAI6966828.1 hypothetical protein KC329_g14721 [Hortaea werneckii]KAI7269592.1 hypothetical protein KC335_g6282 [Hortaea werneckii]KAI7400793.1 hypothetical protein KC332_g10213 [Hortaea werneckii]KAI7424797.1 hypothetical protein KC336_g7068 [Hortaea werneckii]